MRCPSCEVVRANARAGYPTDYLVARIKGRQGTLISDWDALIARGLAPGLSDEEVWGTLLRELEWLHRQMNETVLLATAPLVGLFEMKTLVLALRNVAIGRTAVVRTLLEHSLLATNVKHILLEAPDVRTALNRLARLHGATAHVYAALPDVYAQGKLRALEDAVMRSYLEAVIVGPLHRVLRDFFALFIDLRNVMLVYKHLRWEVPSECRLIRGGTLERRRLQQILVRHDLAGLDALVRRTAGRSHPSAVNDAGLETLLLRAITTNLVRLRRDEQHVAVIASYMWRLYIQARNLAVLVHGDGVDAEVLHRELIA